MTYKEKDTVTWCNIDGLHNLELMEEIANYFHFELAEVLNTRAKRPSVAD